MNNIPYKLEASEISGKHNPADPGIEDTCYAAAGDSRNDSSCMEIDEDSLYKRLVAHKLNPPAGKSPLSGPETRYRIEKLIGEGSMGNVFAAIDCNFDRDVALKIPKGANITGHGRDDFIKEAKVSASLEHPNIIPVYDLNVDNNGNIYMSMRKICGHSLKQYIDAVKSDAGALQLMKIEEILLIFLKVCDAIEYAHSKGKIHQDIKPDNIMTGGFGEVFLIDWGSSTINEDDICLTPAYMSPEQAAKGYADERSDVFCLAATLFHVLTLRFPTMSQTTQELWIKRSKGILDPLTDEERKRIPPPLMAIVMKGLEGDPKKRYQSIAEFSRDLKQYQGGLAVSAFHDTLLASFVRWYRRNRKSFWMSLLVMVIVAVFGSYVWNEKLKEIAYWGSPVYAEKIKNNDWLNKWVEYQGAFEIKKRRLVTVPGKGDAYILVYREKLSGSIAIEFDAEVIPGSMIGDLSVLWAPDIIWDKDRKNILNIYDIYYFQTGAWGNNFSRIAKSNMATLSYSPFTLTEGHKYKIRAEIDGVFMQLFVDGKLLCQYKGLFPLSSGYVGLYGYFPGKAFDNIKIYCKGVPEKMNATYIGDAFYRKGMFNDALVAYQEVMRSHKGRTIAEDARYKAGLCLYSLGEKVQAYELWQIITDDDYRRQATFHFWVKQALEDGAHDQVIKEIGEMYEKSNTRQRQEIINEWGTLVGMMSQSSQFNSLDKYLELREKIFKDDISQKREAVQILLSMGRYDQVIKEYPEFKADCTEALIALGRFAEVLEKYPDQRYLCALALSSSEHPEQVLEKYPEQRELCAKALLASDHPEQVLEKCPDQKASCASALFASGRFAELLEKYPDQRASCAYALIATGHPEQMLEKYPDQRASCAFALFASGRFVEVLENYPDQRYWCAQALLASGHPDQVLEKYPDQRVSCAYALIASGHPEQALKKYPDNKVTVLMANYCMGFKLLETGDNDKAKKLISLIPGQPVARYYYMARFADIMDLSQVELIYLPFAEYLINPQIPLGKRFKDALATKKHFSQVLWFQASFILGSISQEQFLTQPNKLQLESRLILAKAMKAEYAGENDKAIQYYTAYQALPGYKKALNPVINAFVEWRLKELAKK